MAAAGKTRKIFDGRYEILSIVGRGACSVVYHARHAMAPASEVALKVLLTQRDHSSNGDRLRKEALAMVSCRHRYVIRLDDFHSVGDLCYLSMEYAPESDLRRFAATKGGQLTPAQLEVFLLQAADALGFIHRAGIVHRDLKPDNILVVNEKESRLADFGVAVLPGEESSIAELQRGVGTMAYMAPEVLEGVRYDQRSDVYALAVTFYELLTGSHPFESAPLMKQLEVRREGAFPALQEVNPNIPVWLAQPLMQALSYDAAKRFPSGAELQAAIMTMKRSGGTASKRNAVAVPAEKPAPAPEQKPAAKPPPRAAPAATEPARSKPPPAGPRPASPAETTPARAAPARPMPAPEVRPQVQAMPAPMATAAGNAAVALATEPPVAAAVTPAPVPAATAAEAAPATGLAGRAMAGIADEPAPRRAAPPGSRQQSAPRQSGPSLAQAAAQAQQKADRAVRQKTTLLNRETVSAVREEAQRQPRSELSRRDPKKSALMAVSIAVFFLIIAQGNLFLKRNYNIDLAHSIMHFTSSTPSDAPSLLPPGTTGALDFPALPGGVFTGSITDLVPGQTATLSLLSYADQGFVVVIAGIEGFRPALVQLDQKQPNGALRVASNGMILDLTGQVVEGEIVGYFRNIVTGEEGEWRARAPQP